MSNLDTCVPIDLFFCDCVHGVHLRNIIPTTIFRSCAAMTKHDKTPTAAVYMRDAKAMFLIRGGQAFKLSGNWRRMHIRTRDEGCERIGRSIESSGAHKINITPFRGPLATLVENAIGKGCAMDDLGHIPLF